MAPGSDTEILNDESTLVPNPQFVAQVAANYPGSVSGLTVLAEFSSLHGGTFDLAPGLDQRGFVGNFDVQPTTDASGRFVIQAPFLSPGNKKVRVLVIGQPDSPPCPVSRRRSITPSGSTTPPRSSSTRRSPRVPSAARWGHRRLSFQPDDALA
jgi:hypothetical protein